MSGEEKRRFWLQFFFFFTILHSPLTNCENCQRAVWGGSQKSNRQLATCNSKSATVQHVELLAKLQILSQLNNCHTKTKEKKKKTNRLRFSFPFTRNVFLFYQFFYCSVYCLRTIYKEIFRPSQQVCLDFIFSFHILQHFFYSR